jgi:hypothetical protein
MASQRAKVDGGGRGTGRCVHVVVAAKTGLAVEASALELISTLARPPKVVHANDALLLLLALMIFIVLFVKVYVVAIKSNRLDPW